MKPLKTIGETIIEYRRQKPDSSCEEITAFIKKHFPKCNTNPASVACTLGKAAKRLGDARLRPGKVGGDEELPSFDVTKQHDDNETEEQARERILLRYRAMGRLGPNCIEGKVRSLIISGPPGVSKGYTITEAFELSGRRRHDGFTDVGGGGKGYMHRGGDDLEEEELEMSPGYYDHISGTCSAVGLYRAAWHMRNGGVIFLDDCDTVFRDEDALNLLKIMTDSTRERLVSWRKNSLWLEEDGIDRTFDFKGQVIFITNLDFEEIIRRSHRDSEHFKALIDRAAYLCLTIRTARDYMIVIDWKAAGRDGFLHHEPYGLNAAQIAELMGFVRANQARFYNLSLRLVGQIAIQMKAEPEHWKADVTATKMRTI